MKSELLYINKQKNIDEFKTSLVEYFNRHDYMTNKTEVNKEGVQYHTEFSVNNLK